MNSDEISSKLLSNDSSSVLEGCFEVRNSNDRIILRAVAEKVLPNLAHIEKVELGGSIVPNKHWLELALTKLELSVSDACFCAMYLHSNFFDPQREQDSNNVSTELTAKNIKTWSTAYISCCRNCGQFFEVHGEAGWHRPWWKWIKIEAP